MLAWFVATAPDMTPGNLTEPWEGVSQAVIEHRVESKERPPIPENWSLEPGVQGFVQVTCFFLAASRTCQLIQHTYTCLTLFLSWAVPRAVLGR